MKHGASYLLTEDKPKQFFSNRIKMEKSGGSISMINIAKKIMKFLTDPYVRFFCLDYLGIYKKMSDEEYLKKKFRLRVGYELDITNPKSFNEKIQWLKLYDRNPLYIDLVDKIKVKSFVASKIGYEYIVPTLDVWTTSSEFSINKLPSKFVLKCNHNSGTGMYICKDKSCCDISKIRRNLAKGLRENYYLYNREWPYKDIERKILAEELLENDDGSEVLDYKLLVFNGKVKCSFVCTERFSPEGMKVTFFDEQWEEMPFERHYPKSNKAIPKPKNYKLMIELAEKLAAGIRFVRIDFYEVNSKVYFGEMTFYPGSGFEEFTPKKWDYILGDYIIL